MPTISVPDGGTIYYAERKVESTPYPPVILIHGAGGTHLDWPAELRRLPNTRVIALDLPGHGRSAGPGRTDTLAYAGDVVAFLSAAGIRRAIMAGHSMGGAIAQQLALHWPEKTAGLVLIGTGSKLPVDPTLPQRIIDETGKTVRWIVDWSWSPGTPESVKARARQRLLAVDPEVLRGDYLACQGFDVRDQIDRIAAPALVLGAADDNMVKVKFSATLAERIPHARLVVIEGAGHMFPLERAKMTADAITQWLEQTWSESSAG